MRPQGVSRWLAPEYQHLPDVMRGLGWRTGRPTAVNRLPRLFFRDHEGQRWEVKRSPQDTWRIRHCYDVFYPSVGTVWKYQWFPQAPAFESPVAAVLWFDRIGTALLKLGAIESWQRSVK